MIMADHQIRSGQLWHSTNQSIQIYYTLSMGKSMSLYRCPDNFHYKHCAGRHREDQADLIRLGDIVDYANV